MPTTPQKQSVEATLAKYDFTALLLNANPQERQAMDDAVRQIEKGSFARTDENEFTEGDIQRGFLAGFACASSSLQSQLAAKEEVIGELVKALAKLINRNGRILGEELHLTFATQPHACEALDSSRALLARIQSQKGEIKS